MIFNEKDTERRQHLGAILKGIHSKIPQTSVDKSTIGDSEICKGFLDGIEVERLIIYLRAVGCQYQRDNEHGGCTMCGHITGTTRGEKISAEQFMAQFDKAIAGRDFSKLPIVCLYNEGSLLNDNELPAEARNHMLKRLGEIPAIKKIIIESRPEYVTNERCKAIKSFLPKRQVEVGMGLESSNEYIRQMCLNKGLNIEEYANAVRLLKEHEIKSLAYVLQKPPFLTEKAGLEDAVSTTKWAFEQGVDTVSLEPTTVQQNTLIELLYNMGEFEPPWLYSAFKTVQQTAHLGPIRIGGYEYFPEPKVFARGYCFREVASGPDHEVVERYNASHDMNIINYYLDESRAKGRRGVPDFQDWQNDLLEDKSIQQKIDEFLDKYKTATKLCRVAPKAGEPFCKGLGFRG